MGRCIITVQINPELSTGSGHRAKLVLQEVDGKKRRFDFLFQFFVEDTPIPGKGDLRRSGQVIQISPPRPRLNRKKLRNGMNFESWVWRRLKFVYKETDLGTPHSSTTRDDWTPALDFLEQLYPREETSQA